MDTVEINFCNIISTEFAEDVFVSSVEPGASKTRKLFR
jgi:hypothetical protein